MKVLASSYIFRIISNQMGKIRILIIEDEADLAEDLKYSLEEIGYEVAGIAPDLKEAYGLFYTQKPDIIIVDITLGDEAGGIEFAKNISLNLEHKKPFIFLTGSDDKATFNAAKKTLPAGYLLKPFNILELQYAIELAIDQFHSAGEVFPDCIFMKKGNNFVKVAYADIQYASVEGKYSEVYVKDHKYLVQCSLKELGTKLPNSFVRVHNNYIVNLHQVQKFNHQDSQVFLKNDTFIPVSKRMKTDLLERMNVLK